MDISVTFILTFGLAEDFVQGAVTKSHCINRDLLS